MMLAILILGLFIAFGVLVAMAVRDLANEQQFLRSLWQIPVGVFALALFIGIVAQFLVNVPYGVGTLTLLIALLAGGVGYMVGATLSLFGISLRSLIDA